MRICVYGAASPTIDPYYIEKVELLGEEMVKRGHSLVFGGGGNGLMGAAARGVKAQGGKILGVIPEFFKEEGVEAIFSDCDEMIMPKTMRERKQIMEDNSDAFIVVPGGIGTFEEFFEILTLKQLCRHNKPIAIYNVKDYYNELDAVLQKAMEKNFIRENCSDLYLITDDLKTLFDYIEEPVKHRTVKELKDG
ncbi:MAG: TIGR00730 family Rossman fold protein [Clostridia bacterium]|nr:TIGR00730 family Rossman fold protein [Clostridia bacterium]